MTDHIKRARQDDILTITIDRQDKKNALTEAMYAAMADALEKAETDDQIRVVLFRAEGELFTAGNDIMEFASVALTGISPAFVLKFLYTLARFPKPIVAAVQGKAVGIGTTLLLHCDYVILAENAELTTPFVNLALVPEAASSLMLPQLIGHQRAFGMFALGEPLSASDALAHGVANAVVSGGELAAKAHDIANRLAKQPIGALMTTKRMMRDVSAHVKRIEAEAEEFGRRLKSPEAMEAFRAFAEKRPPDFKKVT